MPETSNLSGQHILLGISGGIAAYKTPILVRRLVEAGASVQVGDDRQCSPVCYRYVASGGQRQPRS